MKTVKFNQRIHDLCDPPARAAVTKYIKESWNLTATEYEMYKVDLIIKDSHGQAIGYAEIEMRDWYDCPFSTIHIPQRKKKLFDNDMKTIYFVVNNNLSKAWYINTNSILEHPLREVSNTRLANGEYFYDVPKNLFTQINLLS
jgi:hypothetical protein